jgi:xylan 1,4-beta-xylosidase
MPMRITPGRLLLAALALATTAAARPEREARFDWFEYRGVEPGPAMPAGSYRNPILSGFYSDPSLLRVGGDFYLVNSTFSWFPGIPVFHSRDLVHWRQIGNAIDRPTQLDFSRLGMSRGIYAPAITQHDGRFFIVTTCVDCGGNFVITARDPAGPWSDPVWLKDVEGIDPSLFFDEDGSAWIANNRGPQGKPLYEGHRAIWLQRFDPVKLQTTGTPKLVVNGGVDIAAKPVWIEGPHLFKQDGHYYLSAAEGGTSVNHSQVIFRADRVDGPYVPAPASVNPILTQRDLDPARPHPVTSAGHADMVRLADGSWWAAFLATRPYAGDLYNTGRETFLLPVTWRDGWPVILPKGRPVPTFVARPPLPLDAAPPTSGSFTARDEFDGSRLDAKWMMMRTPKDRWWRLGGGALWLQARGVGFGTAGQPSLVARRQQHADAIATTSLTFSPDEGAAAGLALVQNDDFFLASGLTREHGQLRIALWRRAGAEQPARGVEVANVPIAWRAGTPVRLRVHARGGRYDFDYALGGGGWRTLAHDVDGTNLSTAKAGGFVGTMIGPFAQGPR